MRTARKRHAAQCASIYFSASPNFSELHHRRRHCAHAMTCTSWTPCMGVDQIDRQWTCGWHMHSSDADTSSSGASSNVPETQRSRCSAASTCFKLRMGARNFRMWSLYVAAMAFFSARPGRGFFWGRPSEAELASYTLHVSIICQLNISNIHNSHHQ